MGRFKSLGDAMKYVKLIDYIDRPEMIRHVDGREVKGIEHFPSNRPPAEVVVHYMHGPQGLYYKNGKYLEAEHHSSFVLKEDILEQEPESGSLFNPNQKLTQLSTERVIEIPMFLFKSVRVEGDKVIITLKGDIE